MMSRAPRDVARLDREAARWLADQEGGLLDAAGEARLKIWLETPANAHAFTRAQSLWRDMGQAARPALPAWTARSERRARHTPPSRIGRSRLSIAAGLAAALVLACMMLDIPTRLNADVLTRPGEQRTVRLGDGSVVQVNTDSAIALAYTPDRRTVRLLRGEAAFTVAPDAQRPFRVEAGGGSTTALGTRFVVRRRGSMTQVSVTEHAVRVATRPGSVTTPETMTSTYRPHQAPSAPRPSSPDIDAWTQGWLVFEDRPLAEVVEEIARYSPTPITVLGRAVRNRRVSGAFRIDQPSRTLARLEQTLGVRATRLPGGAVIIHG
jgi:transmembrane sensor